MCSAENQSTLVKRLKVSFYMWQIQSKLEEVAQFLMKFSLSFNTAQL